MLKIRLQRVGKKKKPAYRFVVSESSKDLYGKHLEILGHYDPFTKVIEVKKDRIQYWISVGAQPSPTAHNLLVDQNVINKPKVVASKGKKKKKDGEDSSDGASAKSKEKVETKPTTEVKAEEKVDKKSKDKPVEETKSEEKAPKEAKKEDESIEANKEEAKKEQAAE